MVLEAIYPVIRLVRS